MSFENGTTHYNLPITQGSDKRDWFDTNEGFTAIDAAIHTAVEECDTLAKDVSTIKADVAEAQTNIKSLESYDATNTVNVQALQALTAQHTVDIEDVRQDSEDMVCAIEEASATAKYAHAVGEFFRYNDTLYVTTVAIGVGDTIVPNVNCKTTDVVSQLGDGSVAARVGTVDISSYGASVTDAIANSKIKALDGDIYTLKNGQWSPMLEDLGSISIDSNDHFTLNTSKCYKYGNVVYLYFSLKCTSAVGTETNIPISSNIPTDLIGAETWANFGGRWIKVYLSSNDIHVYTYASTIPVGENIFATFTYLTE